jgi:hypothetical protein
MKPFHRVAWFSPSFAMLLFLAPVRADEPITGSQTQPEVKKATASKFLRIIKDDDGPTALETAVVRYRPAKGNADLTVDLIGVVHLGEKSYYRRLNKVFEQYDALLYELVAPQGTKPAKGQGSANPLRIVQKIMSVALDLESQIEHVDYTKKNFVHADLSPAEMAEAIKKRGDTGLTLALSVAADLLRQQNLKNGEKPGSDTELPDLASLVTDPTALSKIKRLLASQLAAIDAPGAGLGPTLNTILVEDRNKAAMKVLKKEIDRGQKKIAIFYGAAHMPDFEKRLRDELGLVPVSTTWVHAWDLRLRERGLEELLFRALRDTLK